MTEVKLSDKGAGEEERGGRGRGKESEGAEGGRRTKRRRNSAFLLLFVIRIHR